VSSIYNGDCVGTDSNGYATLTTCANTNTGGGGGNGVIQIQNCVGSANVITNLYWSNVDQAFDNVYDSNGFESQVQMGSSAWSNWGGPGSMESILGNHC